MKKSPPLRLGRGLAALLGDDQEGPAPPSEDVTERAQNMSVLGVDRLEPARFQPRQAIDETDLVELTESIRTRGILQPILVRPMPNQENTFQIIAGERRWRAAQRAGLHEVPVHIRHFDDADAMAAALVENLQRADLNAIEEAEGLQRLQTDFALTQEELSDAIGKSRSHIANTLRILNLPHGVRQLVKSGKLTAGHARALLAHPDPVSGAAIVIARHLNVRQTEALAKQVTATNAKPRRQTSRDDEIIRLESDLARHLGLKVKIAYDGKGGYLRLDYRSLDQFENLMRLLKP